MWEQIRQKSIDYRDYTAGNLSELVRIPSLCGNEEQVIVKARELLECAGFDEVRIDGLGNLLGRIGEGDRVLAIDAHIDTVDTGDTGQWELEPFSGEVKDGWVHGRGSVDQKGGAASMITAGRILKEVGYRGSYRVYFTFTIMEEDCEGLCWNYLIEKETIAPDCAVITEPTNLGVYRGHRGRIEIELFFKGISSHGSAPERGDNAIYKASDAVLKIKELDAQLKTDDFLGKGSIAVTLISSDSPSLCSIPDRCMLHIDRRLTWGEDLSSATKEIADVVAETVKIEVPIYNTPSYRGECYPQKRYFPTWRVPENHELVLAGVKTYSLLFGDNPVVGKWAFSTNGVSLCGTHNIPTIGFGPGNEVYSHAPNEKVPIDDLEKASAFYALLPFVLDRAARV